MAAKRRHLDPATCDYIIDAPVFDEAVFSTFEKDFSASDFYSRATGFDGSSTMTRSIMFRTSNNLSAQMLSSKQSSNDGWLIQIPGNTFLLWRVFNGVSPVNLLSSALVHGTTYCATMVLDGATMRLSLSGFVTVSIAFGSYSASAAAFGLGASGTGSGPASSTDIWGFATSDSVALSAAAAEAHNVAVLAAQKMLAFTGAESVFNAPLMEQDSVGSNNLLQTGNPTEVRLKFASGGLLVGGGLREDESHTSTVVLLLKLVHGSCPVAPELGNKILTQLKKLGDGSERRAEAFAREALLPLTRPRLISDLDVEAIVTGARLDLQVNFTDQDGAPRSIRLPIIRGA